MEKQTTRRGLLKNAAAAAAGVTGVVQRSTPAEAEAQTGIVWEKKIVRRAPTTGAPGEKVNATPATANQACLAAVVQRYRHLWQSRLSFRALARISKAPLKSTPTHVLDEIEANLKLAGSSMDKVLKVNVYLADLKYYAGMNSVYQGRVSVWIPACPHHGCRCRRPG